MPFKLLIAVLTFFVCVTSGPIFAAETVSFTIVNNLGAGYPLDLQYAPKGKSFMPFPGGRIHGDPPEKIRQTFTSPQSTPETQFRVSLSRAGYCDFLVNNGTISVFGRTGSIKCTPDAGTTLKVTK